MEVGCGRWVVVRLARQVDTKGGSAARSVLHPREASMELRESGHERESDAQPGRRVGAIGRLSERFEDDLCLVRRDAGVRYAWLMQIAEGMHFLQKAGALIEGIRPDFVTVRTGGGIVIGGNVN